MKKPESVLRVLRSPWVLSALALLLLTLVAYPRPGLLFRHIHNLLHPPVHSQIAAEIGSSLPDDPGGIEAWVFENITRDANDYSNWGVVFYFASPEEVLSIGKGACYARAIVLASILQDKSISYQLYIMPGHIWVDYAERTPYVWGEGLEWLEYPENAIFRWEDGKWSYQGWGWIKVLPAMARLQFQLYWRIIPLTGKLLIGVLLLVVLVWGCVRIRRRSMRKSSAKDDAEAVYEPR